MSQIQTHNTQNNTIYNVDTDLVNFSLCSQKCKKCVSPFLAFLLICICAATSGLQKVIIKLLTDVGPFTISCVRFAIIFSVSFPFVIYRYIDNHIYSSQCKL